MVRWQIVATKTSFIHTQGKGKERFFFTGDRGWVGVWHGTCVNNCTGAKYKRMLLEERMGEKHCIILLFDEQ